MISAIIPVYNHANFVGPAIESCLRIPEISEILVADDGSNDRSLEIVEFYADRFPARIRNLTGSVATNLGAHNRINALCAQAAGEWLAVLNSDDLFHVGRFRNFDRIVKMAEADIVFGNCQIIDGAGAEIGVKFPGHDLEYPLPEGIDQRAMFQAGGWLPLLLNQNIVATTSNMVIRRSFFERIGGFSAFRYVHDWDFLLRAAVAGRLAHSVNMWTSYRVHTGNTISESNFAVRAEVQAMFTDFLRSEAYLSWVGAKGRGGLAAQLLGGNQYLRPAAPLALISNQSPNSRLARQFSEAVSIRAHGIGVADVPARAPYVYAPSAGAEPLSANELRNLVLSAAVGDFDVVSALTALSERDRVGAPRLRDVSLVRREVLADIVSGSKPARPIRGRIVRLPRAAAPPTRLLTDIAGDAGLRQDGPDFELGPRHDEPLSRPRRQSLLLPDLLNHLAGDPRPVVFVLPGFIAVGGAENVLVEVMRRLKDRYAFIVICTERLEIAQGSWAHRALEHCEAIYDLAEALPQADFFEGLAWLKAAYAPKLVFLTNGTMWQVGNASRLRRFFRGVAIVDQQVYDTHNGWIEWFDHPGVRAADRFIAVNQRIAERFDELGLPAEKVDLIYSPIDAERIERKLGGIDLEKLRAQFGLASDQPVFVFMGRMNEQKRPLDFLALAERAQRDGIDAQFVMVGQGELSTEVRATIARDGLDNVIRIDYVAEVEDLFFVSDLLVITSAYEGLPLAMLQAMSAGTPVLSTDVGDIGIVLQRYTGAAVVNVDAGVEALYSEMVATLAELPQRKVRAAEAAAFVRRDFSSTKVAELYDQCFRTALQAYLNPRKY
jgi:glycosyltransferase involved in cell wall biosynthesis